MTMQKTVALAAALIAAATSVAMAQSAPTTGANGNNGMPPDSYKGPGGMPGYSGSDFMASPSPNNGGARGANGSNGMPPDGYKGPGAMPTYSASDFR
jgi:hypothetical protein